MSEGVNDSSKYEDNPSRFATTFIHGEDLESHSERVTASFVFVVDDINRILVLKNERGWDIPGGHLDDGEGAEAAAHREVDEEACVVIKDVSPFALIKNGPTAMAVFTAKPELVKDFVVNEEDPTSDRTFMDIPAFMEVYSGGDKTTMTTLVTELAHLIEANRL